ncbi:cellulase family glycosylhydrolase [Fulvivirgaceae bacterium PWU5]|uniref:Cellulase family glycosylhydrolase n=1 Tax=Dawidia cretensis TaxID=2782350 RepID=A0AAP2DZ13_9BACT|nr:cellulase family glycosylhydrolase [Dawidia cretensis]MBT1709988.1 cellulase family glycosylhydrolase [Dawidia cretensis]
MTRRLYPLHACLFALALIVSVVSAQAQKPWLHIDGNQIKDPAGNPVTLRGVSVLPSEHHNECTTCNNKPMSEMIAWQADGSRGWYSRVLRLPVTTAKVKDPATSFATHIDPYVQQAIALNQYVIVDLHLVSNYDVNGSGGVKQQFVMDFWKYVAPRYANTPNVIFEIFNEPVNPDNWTSWKNYIQPVIDSIRAVAPNNLILVGSPQWSTRVNSAVTNPLTGGNLVYVYHIYPNQGAATAANLNTKFGNAANTIPVMLTEFGWNQDPNYSDGVTFGTTGGWGTPFRNYIDAHPWISWQGWIFDNFWKPQFFDWNWNLMSGENQGRFMQNWLFELQNHNQPGGAGGIGTQTPYATHTIPGRIQTEDFDIGAQDVAYHDTDLGNNGNSYRSTDVDLGTTTDIGGGYVVGYTMNGEWLEYTLGSVAAGNYNIGIRSASASSNAGKNITVKLDGVTLGTVTPNNTGAWETWETLALNNISIAGGSNKVLRLEIAGGSFNLNYIEFTPVGLMSTLYEAETTSRWSSGASNTVVAQAQASGGNLVRVSADGVGDFVEYTYTHTGMKNYDVYLGFRAGPDQGTGQVYKDGAAYGSVFDLYSPTTVYKEVLVANLTFYTGQQKVRFTVAGKNTSSTGYQFTHDYIKLVDHATTLNAGSALRQGAGPSLIQVFPNPATTVLKVNGVPEDAAITIRDATGNLRLSQQAEGNDTSIDVQRLRPGLHILRVVYGDEVFTYTFLKE